MNSKMIPVAVINPDAPAESLEAKQPAIDNGAEIYGKDGYFSADQMQCQFSSLVQQCGSFLRLQFAMEYIHHLEVGFTSRLSKCDRKSADPFIGV